MTSVMGMDNRKDLFADGIIVLTSQNPPRTR